MRMHRPDRTPTTDSRASSFPPTVPRPVIISARADFGHEDLAIGRWVVCFACIGDHRRRAGYAYAPAGLRTDFGPSRCRVSSPCPSPGRYRLFGTGRAGWWRGGGESLCTVRVGWPDSWSCFYPHNTENTPRPMPYQFKKRPNMPPKRGYMLKHLILLGEGCVCSSGLSTLADTR